jgi:hypothetical protein
MLSITSDYTTEFWWWSIFTSKLTLIYIFNIKSVILAEVMYFIIYEYCYRYILGQSYWNNTGCIETAIMIISNLEFFNFVAINLQHYYNGYERCTQNCKQNYALGECRNRLPSRKDLLPELKNERWLLIHRIHYHLITEINSIIKSNFKNSNYV